MARPRGWKRSWALGFAGVGSLALSGCPACLANFEPSAGYFVEIHLEEEVVAAALAGGSAASLQVLPAGQRAALASVFCAAEDGTVLRSHQGQTELEPIDGELVEIVAVNLEDCGNEHDLVVEVFTLRGEGCPADPAAAAESGDQVVFVREASVPPESQICTRPAEHSLYAIFGVAPPWPESPEVVVTLEDAAPIEPQR